MLSQLSTLQDTGMSVILDLEIQNSLANTSSCDSRSQQQCMTSLRIEVYYGPSPQYQAEYLRKKKS